MALKPINLSDFSDDNPDNEDDFEIVIEENKQEEDPKEELSDEDLDSLMESSNDEEDAEHESEEENFSEDNEADEEEAEEEEGDSEDDDDEDPTEEEGKHRYNERIRQVIAQRNAERERADAADKKAQETQNALIQLQKDSVESNKTMLESHKESLKAQLKQAIEESNTEQIIDLQEKITQATTQVQAYEAWKPEEIVETKENQQAAPAELLDWMADNPWFQNPQNDEDKERAAIADAHSRILLSKGFTFSDPELFTQVDARLSDLGLAKGKKKMVQSETKNKNSSVKDVKPKKKSKKKVSQTVQGASRTSPNAAKSRRKVPLSREEIRIANVMGISPKEYADEKMRIEQSKKGGNKLTTLK